MNTLSTGFNKIIRPESFSWGLETSLSALVDDPDVFRKVASSSIADRWAGEKAPANHSLVHLIALGDFEKVGCNRNGDAFEAAINEALHPTFVKYAKLYRNHKIGPKKGEEPRPGGYDEGFVVKSAYNKDMGRVELLVAASHEKCADWLGQMEMGDPVAFSMGFNCVFPGQLVTTRGSGQIPIEDVVVGDEVITSSGKWRGVTHTHKNPLGGRKKILAKVCGSADPLEVTDDHPVYVVQRAKVRTKSGHLRRNPEWIHEEIRADEIKKGDYLVRPVRPLSGESSPGEDLAYVAGQYVGDGHLGKVDGEHGGAVHITLHRHDEETLAKLINISVSNGWQFSVDFLDGENRSHPKLATTFRLRDPGVAEFCKEFGVKKRKHCSESVFSWSRNEALSFLAGYHDADGCTSGGALRFSSVLSEVAYGMSDLALSCGLPASVNKDFIGNNEDSFGTAEFAYVGFIPKSCLGPLSPYSTKVAGLGDCVTERSHQIRFYEQDGATFAAMPVTGIESESSDIDYVYCLTVEIEHNFVTSGVLVKNCFYDECSICDNKAKKPEFYCDHVKKEARAPYGMGKILPDGRKCHVFNRKGFYNDISEVGIGADMTAFDLRKVASLAEENGRVLSGAELAEQVYVHQFTPANPEKVRLIGQFVQMEKRARAMSLPFGEGSTMDREVTRKTASALLEASTPADMFTHLGNLGVVLPMSQFFKVAMANDFNEFESDVPKIERHMAEAGGEFSWAKQAGLVDKITENATYDSKRSTHFALDHDSQSKLACDFSMGDQFVKVRESQTFQKLARVNSHEFSPSQKIAQINADQLTPKQAALAAEYLAYKISAVRDIPLTKTNHLIASLTL